MILAKQDQLQQRGEKKFKSKQYWRSNIFIFVKIMKIAAICFWCVEFMPKISTVFRLYFSKLLKIKQCSIVNP